MDSSEAAGTAGEPAGLYVHVPFCARVCPYCDFAVLVDAPQRRARYLQALLLEIDAAAFPAIDFDTLYLGGGTPSLLRPDEIAAILDAIRDRFRLRTPWLTLEANPEDVSAQAAAAWRELGVRTLSLGVQSFHDDELRFLGRAHDGKTAVAAIETGLQAGFDVVSVDLIYGLPGQSRGAWHANLDRLLSLRPQHSSCYQLTVHEGTRFGKRRSRGELAEMPTERQAELFLATHDRFSAAGWDCYEVSNFASRPEHRSRHNSKYWRHAPYLGLGPSAHSFDGAGRRWWNWRRLDTWDAAIREVCSGIEEAEDLTASQQALEAVMFGLRTSDGIDLEAVRNRCGLDLWEANRQRVEGLVTAGFLSVDGPYWRPTPRGMAVAEWLAVQIDVSALD